MIGDGSNRPKREPKEINYSDREMINQQQLDSRREQDGGQDQQKLDINPQNIQKAVGIITLLMQLFKMFGANSGGNGLGGLFGGAGTGSSSSTGGSSGSGDGGRRGGLSCGCIITIIIVLVLGFFLLRSCGSMDLGSLLGEGYESPGVEIGDESESQSTPEELITNDSSASGYRWLVENAEPVEKKPYTVMVYINGSDLESRGGFASSDIAEMVESRFNEDNLNVILLTGGTKRWQTNGMSRNLTVYKVTNGTIKKIADLGKETISDTKLLTAFADYGIKAFPADKYGFVFWNHGGGTVHGYGADENYGGKNMSIAQIADAFEASELTSNRLEFVGFDCCLMATIETAHVLKPYARYFIASEEVEPGNGWDYTFLSTLANNPKASGDAIGKVIVDKYIASIRTRDDATLSVVDLDKLEDLVGEFEKLSVVAKDAIDEGDFNRISKARKNTKSFGYVGESQSFDLVDIKHLAVNLSNEFPYETENLIDALDNCVVYNRTSKSLENCYGLSTYIPYVSKYQAKESVVGYQKFGLLPKFTSFLTSFTEKLTGNKLPRPDISKAKPKSLQNGEIAITLSKKTVEEINSISMVIFKQDEPGSDYFVRLGMDSDVEINSNGRITTMFDGYWATLGGQTACFYEIEKSQKATKYSVPAILNGQNVYIIVVFDEENPNGLVLGAVPPPPDGSSVAAKEMLPIKAGDEVALKYMLQLFLKKGDDGSKYTQSELWVAGEAFKVKDELAVEIVPVDDELYMYGFQIEDVYGNQYFTDFIEIRY